MKFTAATYHITLTKMPFTLTLRRDHAVILTMSTTLAAKAVQQRGEMLTVKFAAAALTLTLHDASLDVSWRGQDIANTFPLATSWYGQGELIHQHWPLNKLMLQEDALLTVDNGPTGLLCIQSPLWFTAQGIGLLAHSPVRVGFNQPPAGTPRFVWDFAAAQGPAEQRPRLDPGGQGDGHFTLAGDDLRYTIFIAADLPAAFRAVRDEIGHPTATPPNLLFARPTWTTWARFKDKINQETILRFAREIIEHKYPYGVLEIDDRWQTQYGDLEFDPRRFPDARAMIAALHADEFKVTAWTMPFAHPDSQAAAEGAARGYFVRTAEGKPYLIRWWQGPGYLLDATNPAALEWFGMRLRALQTATGLDGFKFDAGEAIFLPEDAATHTPLASRNEFTHQYVDWIGRNFSLCEVRSGWQNQRAPIFFRLWDETSNWTHANGLRSIIPSALSLSLTGYPFILPDMVGGNAYFSLPERGLRRWAFLHLLRPHLERRAQHRMPGEGAAFGTGGVPLPRWVERAPHFGYPSAELMIRWTQVNALLPAIQFSLPPWEFGPECDVICRGYAQLHEQFSPTLLTLAQEAARTGEPVLRPVFWLAPDDERALACDDEYLVGDELLAAPVVYEGARHRDVYLPPGTWREHWNGKLFNGPTVLKRFHAPLETLPLFKRVG